ncbi:hypothetical protein EOPP23_07350 [Endozoicomonas sp. OPT23]|uniref:ArnT family glycosyltransferase n=1 Tax=Endozoicomonas sp. OPT23 TaxID=2072845 RepID=UPI00129BD77E|nr:hypothetical protein [Endozoicomonas sp. OPT23]MRI32798.1 hypothetical protein [Endozoicomonas sp. OPT23]
MTASTSGLFSERVPEQISQRNSKTSELSSVLTVLAVALTFLIWTIWSYWLFQYPMKIGHDDALFFARGIEHFSVVEISPHFPGYPGFIALASVLSIFTTPESAVVLTSLISAVILPWLLALLFMELSGKDYTPVAVLFLISFIILQPLLAGMALSGLTDLTGLAFFIASLIGCYKKRNLLAGLMLGMMLACRPSFFPLAIGLLIALPLITDRQHLLTTYGKGLLGVILVAVPCLLFVLAKDGFAYFEEGLRFTQGHFQIWGNTVSSSLPNWQQWLNTLVTAFSWPFIAVTLLSLTVGLIQCSSRFITLIIVVYLGWILLAQNPDNLRHFAPVLLLWLSVLTFQLQQLIVIFKTILSLVIATVYLSLFTSQISFAVLDAPAQQATDWFKEHSQSPEKDFNRRVLGTNYAVSTLREELPDWQIYDMYYPSSELVLRQQQGYRLSGTKQTDLQLIAEFPGRFTGEKKLYLYQYAKPVSRMTGRSIDTP